MPIKITSKRNNFRRCGVEHPKEPKTYPDGAFTPAEIAIMQADPMLAVEIVKKTEAESVKPEAEDGKPKTKTRK